LLPNLHFHQLEQRIGDAGKDVFADLLIALQLLPIKLNRSLSDVKSCFKVQGILNIRSEQDGLVRSLTSRTRLIICHTQTFVGRVRNVHPAVKLKSPESRFQNSGPE
jgi:hypothetical protein